MKEKITLFITLMNESLQSCGLPELTYKKTRVFVEMNKQLKQMEIDPFIRLVDDYGLLLPAIALSDINVDYAVLLQNKNEIDVSGFVRYVDTLFIRMTQNKKAMMKDITDISDKPPKEMRLAFVKQILEEMVNTKGQSAEEIIHRWQTLPIYNSK